MENEGWGFLEDFFRRHRSAWVDDLAHVAWGFFGALPVAFFAPAWATMLTAVAFCLPREFWDQRRPTGFTLAFGWSRARDIAGFAAGGLLCGILF